MELKKTTILSAFVVIAGLIAEIIFRDVLSQSIPGIVISLVLAVIVFVSFYFTIEGLYVFWNSEREKERKHRKEVEQRLYNILNEQLKFQKVIYNEVHRFVQTGAVSTEKEDISFSSANVAPGLEAVISEEDVEKIVSAVNGHTAKVTQDLEGIVLEISKCTTKTAKELADAVTEINHHTADRVQEIGQMVSDMGQPVETTTETGDMETVVSAIENLADRYDQSVENITTMLSGQNAELENVVEMLGEQKAEIGNAAEALHEQGTELGNITEVLHGQSTELGNITEVLHGQSTELGNITEVLHGQGAEMGNVVTMLGEQLPDFAEMVSGINDHTMNTAKVVAKYIAKTSGELGQKMDEQQQQLLNAVGS